MSLKSLLTTGCLAFVLLLLSACSNSSGSRNAGGTASANAGGSSAPVFAGVGSADAISPTEIVVSWSDATGATGGNSASMIYRIYRAFDAASVLVANTPIFETPPGVTTFVDTNAVPYTTHFYRVEAINTEQVQTATGISASGRTPSTFSGGEASYSDVAALWETTSPSGQRCIDCHDGSPAGGRLDLSSYEGVVAGVGTSQSPDSFVVPFDADATWQEFLVRLTANPTPHIQYVGVADDIMAFEQVLADWVNAGALEEPDSSPPVFEFDDIENAGKYFAEFLDFNTVQVTWFHASDPESLPPSGSTLDQLEYHVYAGESSNTIDWDNPVAELFSPEKTGPNSVITATFDWVASEVVIIVRALDASGRFEQLSDPPTQEELMRRRRNMSINEREIVLSR